MKTCAKCGSTKFIEKPVWCDFTDEAKTMGYKKGGNKEDGIIVSESRDKKYWNVRWVGIKAIYRYRKELIKLIS